MAGHFGVRGEFQNVTSGLVASGWVIAGFGGGGFVDGEGLLGSFGSAELVGGSGRVGRRKCGVVVNDGKGTPPEI